LGHSFTPSEKPNFLPKWRNNIAVTVAAESLTPIAFVSPVIAIDFDLAPFPPRNFTLKLSDTG
jgi:hypothetical protein